MDTLLRDAILPDLNVLHCISTLTDAANDVTMSYDNHTRAQTFQGRNSFHKSWSYNNYRHHHNRPRG